MHDRTAAQQTFANAQARAAAAPGGSGILTAFRAGREAERAAAARRTFTTGGDPQRRSLAPRGHAASRAAYAAATYDRLTAGWLQTANDINKELRADLDGLRARARNLAKNNDYARKFLRLVGRNIVGPVGYTLQARVADRPDQPDDMANTAIEAAWAKWCMPGSADVTGRMSFADLCRNVITAVARDGEALVRLVHGADGATNTEQFALQLLDVARLDTARNRDRLGERNAINMGVEVNAWGRPVAYWVKSGAQASSSTAQRIPASELLHIFVPEMAEQDRGIPWMHAAMLSLHDLGEFGRSAMAAARKGADTLGVIYSPNGGPPPGASDAVGDAGASGTADDDGQETISISLPGQYDVLPEGYELKQFESRYPNEVFDPFTNSILQRVASGLDVSHPSLSSNLSGVNYSSIRAGVIDERDQWATMQAWFAGALIEPVYDAWLRKALLVGAITMPNGSALPIAKFDKFRAHQWQPRRWTWVDPLKDIEAARLEVKSGIASPQDIAARNGADIEDVIKGIARFEQLVATNRVQLINYGSDAATQPPPQQPAKQG